MIDTRLNPVVLSLVLWSTFKITFECTGELSIHGNQGKLVKECHDASQLHFEIVDPYVDDLYAFLGVFLKRSQFVPVVRVQEEVVVVSITIRVWPSTLVRCVDWQHDGLCAVTILDFVAATLGDYLLKL